MASNATVDAARFVIEERHGRTEVDLRVPGVAQVRYVGVASGDVPGPIQTRLDEWITRGLRVTLFVDAAELKSYETEFRTRWAEWMRVNRAHIPAVHILFRSKIVEMGISLVNPLIGGFIVPTSKRQDFEASLERARANALRPS